METYTFKNKENTHTFTVKAEFLKECPKPEEVPIDDLYQTHSFQNFWHNTEGPAFIDHGNKVEFYFIEGKLQRGEAEEKIKYGMKFKDSFHNAIKNEIT